MNALTHQLRGFLVVWAQCSEPAINDSCEQRPPVKTRIFRFKKKKTFAINTIIKLTFRAMRSLLQTVWSHLFLESQSYLTPREVWESGTGFRWSFCVEWCGQCKRCGHSIVRNGMHKSPQQFIWCRLPHFLAASVARCLSLACIDSGTQRNNHRTQTVTFSV
jgi:hypothetical protein